MFGIKDALLAICLQRDVVCKDEKWRDLLWEMFLHSVHHLPDERWAGGVRAFLTCTTPVLQLGDAKWNCSSAFSVCGL